MEKKSAITVFLFFTLFTSSLHAQWAPTNGPVYANISSLSTIDHAIYAGDQLGTFCSGDTANSWVQGLQVNNVVSVIARDTAVFACAWGIGTFRSTDNGTNWIQVSNSLYSWYIYTWAINGNLIFAGGSYGIDRSTNLGGDWTHLGNPDPLRTWPSTTKALALLGHTMIAGLDQSGGVYISPDSGTSWEQRDTGLTNLDVRCLLVHNDTVFIGTGGGIFSTIDTNFNWKNITGNLSNRSIRSLATSGGYVLASTDSGLFVTSNNGLNWVPSPLSLSSYSAPVLAANNSRMFAGTNEGVFASTDRGEKWSAINHGFSHQQTKTLLKVDSIIFAGTYDGGIFVSDNSGMDWSNANSGLTNGLVQALAFDGKKVYAGTYSGAFRSTDRGESWASINNGLTSGDVFSLGTSASSVMAGTFAGIYTSTDSGITWSHTWSGVGIISAIIAAGDIVLAGPPLLRSTDFGLHWAQSGLSNSDPCCFTSCGSRIFAGFQGAGIYLTTDTGATWSEANTGLTDQHVTSIVNCDSILFAGTDGSGVFASTNFGISWMPVNQGIESAVILSLLVNKQELLAAVAPYGGVWHRPIAEMVTSVTEPHHGIPDDFNLSQNFPNPFNPSTIISFSIPRSSFVTLKVFDALGREIITLVNEEMKPGLYQRAFSGSRLASGLYLCQMRSGAFCETRKLILLK